MGYGEWKAGQLVIWALSDLAPELGVFPVFARSGKGCRRCNQHIFRQLDYADLGFERVEIWICVPFSKFCSVNGRHRFALSQCLFVCVLSLLERLCSRG